MSKPARQPCTFRILRYVPNLLRDEWVNIGVILLDRAAGRLLARYIEEPAEFARLRRLHPEADEGLLRRLPALMENLLEAGNGGDDAERRIAKLDESLSNLLQFSPQRAVLAEDAAQELEHIYESQVAPPEVRARSGAELGDTRAGIRRRLRFVFEQSGLWRMLERNVQVAEYTFHGDPMRMDFAYRKNGTRGFVQAVPLLRDAAQAKSLSFTAERIRAHIAGCEFAAVTEEAPRGDGGRYAAVARFLEEQEIRVVPAPQAYQFAQDLRQRIQ